MEYSKKSLWEDRAVLFLIGTLFISFLLSVTVPRMAARSETLKEQQETVANAPQEQPSLPHLSAKSVECQAILIRSPDGVYRCNVSARDGGMTLAVSGPHGVTSIQVDETGVYLNHPNSTERIRIKQE